MNSEKSTYVREKNENETPLIYCDYCDGEIYSGEVYYCPDTGDVIHTDCLLKWARGLVRLCDIEDLLRR